MAEQPRLPAEIKAKVLELPEYRMAAHRVALELRDGRIIENVVVAWGEEIVRVGDSEVIDFDPETIVAVHARS